MLVLGRSLYHKHLKKHQLKMDIWHSAQPLSFGWGGRGGGQLNLQPNFQNGGGGGAWQDLNC